MYLDPNVEFTYEEFTLDLVQTRRAPDLNAEIAQGVLQIRTWNVYGTESRPERGLYTKRTPDPNADVDDVAEPLSVAMYALSDKRYHAKRRSRAAWMFFRTISG